MNNYGGGGLHLNSGSTKVASMEEISFEEEEEKPARQGSAGRREIIANPFPSPSSSDIPPLDPCKRDLVLQTRAGVQQNNGGFSAASSLESFKTWTSNTLKYGRQKVGERIGKTCNFALCIAFHDG